MEVSGSIGNFPDLSAPKTKRREKSTPIFPGGNEKSARAVSDLSDSINKKRDHQIILILIQALQPVKNQQLLICSSFSYRRLK